MASAASKYVTREEFTPVKDAVERLTIRVEVLTNDVHQLTNIVADLAEQQTQFREEVLGKFEASDGRMDKLEQRMTEGFAEMTKLIQDGNAAIMAVLQQAMSRGLPPSA